MAGQALSAGTLGRKRVLFGLMAADGWAWASVKAAFWFVTIVMLLGYIPDRAYYFTVFPTIDLGVNVWSPINFCPPENRTLPCPAPVGAILPWDGSPSQVALPAARTDGAAVVVGSKLLYVGGTDGTNASDATFLTSLYSGNFGPWATGPKLPAARTGAADAILNGTVYVIGGNGPDGKPTDTVFTTTQDSATGALPDFAANDALKLPGARSGAAVAVASDGLILVGGSDGTTIQPTVWKATLDSSGKLQAWKPQTALPYGLEQTSVSVIGSYVYAIGGLTDKGASSVVLQGTLTAASPSTASASPSTTATALQISRAWGVGLGATNLPGARVRAAGFSSNGTLYVVGGSDGSGLRPETYWTVPDANGIISGWQHLAASDLPTGVAGASALPNGSDVFLIGGTTSSQAAVSGSARANLAPQPPFFQLGLLGATVPALKIGGEIGQQLGYLNAAGAGTVDFILLLLVGWAFAHKERTGEIIGRVRHRGSH